LCDEIQQYEARPAVDGDLLFSSYGTASMGLDLTAEAWPKMTQVFSSKNNHTPDCPGRPRTMNVTNVHRLPKTFLHEHPVDLLILGDQQPLDNLAWGRQVTHNPSSQPRAVLEFWDPHWPFREDGPAAKPGTVRWEEAGYVTSCRLVNALQTGGVVNHDWLVVVRIHNSELSL
jgi:hypothetical protein